MIDVTVKEGIVRLRGHAGDAATLMADATMVMFAVIDTIAEETGIDESRLLLAATNVLFDKAKEVSLACLPESEVLS